ncbi:MAG: restriction endonuclease [Oscillochloris sp.]|nr:restriction endonuclease [Oscillochloris sp.]
MSVDTTPEREKDAPEASSKANTHDTTPSEPRVPLTTRISQSLAAVEWNVTLITALVMATTWCVLFLAANILQILAGVVPVMAGLFLGRRVKGNYLAHGLILGSAGFVFGLILVLIYGGLGQAGVVPLPELQLQADSAPEPAGAGDLLFIYVTFSVFALIPFPAFGTVMAGRAEERNRQLRREVEDRGGRLERPNVVRTLEDLQGLSLPQLGSYVSNLYRKKGFEFKDYRFVDKDKHLDLELEYNNERYLLRLSVADKVRPGTLESLVQDMKRRGIPKAVAITSTEFTPDAVKSAANRKNVIAIDGVTLFAMAENG